MKSILYVGATLMIGASIYGFVDYKKTSHRKEFTGMYESKEIKEPVKAVETPLPLKQTEEPAKKTKKLRSSKTFVDEPVTKKSSVEITAAEKIESEPATISNAELRNNDAAEKFKKAKKRKLNSKLFSRAPLRDEVIVEKPLPVPAKVKAKTSDAKKL